MKIDKGLFPVHTIDLNNSKVLIRPEQAEGAKGKNVIIGEKRPITVNDKILAREMVQEKTPDGGRTFKIIVKARIPEGHEGYPTDWSAARPRPVRPISPTGQTGPDGRLDRPGGQPRTFKMKRTEVGTRKTNQPKVQKART